MEVLAVKRNNPETIALWIQRFTDCKNSGRLPLEWCSENGNNVKIYYYWHNKIHKIVSKQQSNFYEVPVTPGSHERTAATIRVGLFQTDDIYSGADA